MDRLRPTVLRSGACAVVLALGLAVAGCGGDDGDPVASGSTTSAPGTTAQRTATTTERSPTTPTPGRGGSTTEAAPPATTGPGAPSGPELTPETERKVFPKLVPFLKVPQESDRDVDEASAKVAEQWFAHVRKDETDAAADLMADGARYSNVVGVVLLKDRAARLGILDDLTCGAVPTEVGGARGGYVVLTLRLVDRKGFPPCDGKGAAVAVSLHVTDGKIDDWVRVLAPDAPINQGTPI
jgi:hypothetical protein